MQNSSLDTAHSARSLGFIFDEHLTFSDQITSLSKACYYHIRQLRCIRPYLDSSTACTIATSIVHFKLDYCNSLYSLSLRTLLLILSLKLPSPVISVSLSSYALSTGSESLSTSSSHLPTKFSHLPNLHTFMTSSLFNVLAVLALHLSLLLIGHLYHPIKITDRSFLYVSPCLWNLPPLPLREPHSGTILHCLLTYSFTHHFFLF